MATKAPATILFVVESAQVIFQRLVSLLSAAAGDAARTIFIAYLSKSLEKKPKVHPFDPNETDDELWRLIEPRLGVADAKERNRTFYKMIFNVFNTTGKLAYNPDTIFYIRYGPQVEVLYDLLLSRSGTPRSTPPPSSVASPDVSIVRATPGGGAGVTKPSTPAPVVVVVPRPSTGTTATQTPDASALGEQEKRKMREILQRLESLQLQYDAWYKQTEQRIVADRTELTRIVEAGRISLTSASDRAMKRIDVSLVKK